MATSAPEPAGIPACAEPMLAKPLAGQLPAGSPWSYEDKVDGYRCAARVAADGRVVLTSRSGRDFTDEFARLAAPIAAMLVGRAGVLDGEIGAYDQTGPDRLRAQSSTVSISDRSPS